MKYTDITDLRSLIDYYSPLLTDLSGFAEATGQHNSASRIIAKIFKDFELFHDCLPENQEKRPRKLRRAFRERAAKLLALAVQQLQDPEETVPAQDEEAAADGIEETSENEIYEYYLDMEYALKEEDAKGKLTPEQYRAGGMQLTAEMYGMTIEDAQRIIETEEKKKEQESVAEQSPAAEAEEDKQEREERDSEANKEATAENGISRNAIDCPFSEKKSNLQNAPYIKIST